MICFNFFVVVVVSNAVDYAENFIWVVSFDTGNDVVTIIILLVREQRQVEQFV